ncbi:MAG: dihydrofolate reductase [Bacteroidetes bacterium]|nr:dihydrofolate reductase [Bacteroidota bacterium]
MIISAVVAVGMNNEIGAKGDLLWVLPKDMAHFKNITWGHHVLMGRKSFEALPPKYRPLPGRPNIIVSRDPDLKNDGCKNVTSIEEGVKFAKDNGEEELMIIGGGEIYKLALPVTDRIYLTRVHASFPEADTHFPEINMTQWETISTELIPADEKHKYSFEIIELRKKQK